MFFLILVAVYGAINLYLYWKVQLALPSGLRLRVCFAIFVAIMGAAPIAAMWLDRSGHSTLANWIAPWAFIWLGVTFWFLMLGLASDAWNVLVHATALLAPQAKAVLLPPRATAIGIGGIILVAVAYGIFEAQNVRLNRVRIEVPRLPGGMKSLKIVQVTDLHLGMHVDGWRLERTLEMIQEAQGDVLVSTGDLVDSPMGQVSQYIDRFERIRPPMGKYAVLGNHEFYAGLTDTSIPFHERAGFRLLRGEAVELASGVWMAGVDDPTVRRGEWNGAAKPARPASAPAGELLGKDTLDENSLLPRAGDEAVAILLKHQPRVSKESLGRFNLQLSGHVHGGQMFPWHLITRAVYPRYRGLYDLDKGSRLYVSPGAGTWGPPLRLLAQPEVTLIELVVKQ